jgi:pantoate--beta-alanine ligase
MDAPNPAVIATVRTAAELRAQVQAWRGEGKTVGLVPTMGALHAGHLSLVRRSLDTTDRTVISLFVNPKQFAPHEDFAVYPRDEDRDRALLAEAGSHLLFAPEVDEMYPAGFATSVSVPGIGDVLEGTFRPGFFTGVATVVAKLLLQCLPDRAFFGEKDYQQVTVVRRMVRDLAIPVEIVGCPTVREADGLALSSRNVYLNQAERAVAPTLNATLLAVAEAVAKGADPAAEETRAAERLLTAGFAKVDYVAVRDAEDLSPPSPDRRLRVLGAAFLGRTRLIDNLPVPA